MPGPTPARAPSPAAVPGAPYIGPSGPASAAGGSGSLGGYVAGVLSSLTRPSRTEDLARTLAICENDLASVRTENKALVEVRAGCFVSSPTAPAPLHGCCALSLQMVQTLRKCAEEAGTAQTVALAAKQAAVEEKRSLSAELQAARDEVASILESSKSIQSQLGDATGAMQLLQGRVDAMTNERDGLTSRITQADADLQNLRVVLRDQTAHFVRLQVRGACQFACVHV